MNMNDFDLASRATAALESIAKSLEALAHPVARDDWGHPLDQSHLTGYNANGPASTQEQTR